MIINDAGDDGGNGGDGDGGHELVGILVRTTVTDGDGDGDGNPFLLRRSLAPSVSYSRVGA
eukprot:1581084-Pyramimonas_sp.AAC.1